MNKSLTLLFNDTCEFLTAVEECHPVPFHKKLYSEWEEDIREYWYSLYENDPSPVEEAVLEAVLAFRKEVYETAIFQPTEESSEGWQWLLDATASEQRTQEWYLEKKDMLTASEISDICAPPRTRGRLVLSKVLSEEETKPFTQRLAVERGRGHAMDWGVRYEPVVKHILEKQLNIKIQDLGRIRHKSIPQLAASPDGLITETDEEHKELAGRLIEIKCPPTREIKEDDVPFSYWCQMQIQMEVCDRPACEYVEVKFKEVEKEDPEAEGWITLEQSILTLEMRYQYHNQKEPLPSQEGWVQLETYGWKMVKMRRVTQQRDRAWFAGKLGDIDAFWKDVEQARAGTWTLPASSRQAKQKSAAGGGGYTLMKEELDE